jgi:hypothetical protein
VRPRKLLISYWPASTILIVRTGSHADIVPISILMLHITWQKFCSSWMSMMMGRPRLNSERMELRIASFSSSTKCHRGPAQKNPALFRVELAVCASRCAVTVNDAHAFFSTHF